MFGCRSCRFGTSYRHHRHSSSVNQIVTTMPPNITRIHAKRSRGIIRCPRKETGSMDGLSPAKQNGGQAPIDLTWPLAFSVVHFISVLTLTGCSYPKRRIQPFLFADVKSRRKSFPARSRIGAQNN